MTLRKLWITSLLLTLRFVGSPGKAKVSAAHRLCHPSRPHWCGRRSRGKRSPSGRFRSTLHWCRPTSRTCGLTRSSMRCQSRTSICLGRVDFGKSIGDTSFDGAASGHGFFKGSMKYVPGLSKAFKMQYISAGFMEMMFLDPDLLRSAALRLLLRAPRLSRFGAHAGL